MDDKYNPHDKSSTEKAEGSTENVNLDPNDVNAGSATDSPMERGSGQVSRPEKPLPPKGGKGKGGGADSGATEGGSAQPAAGITNRPIEEEQQNQEDLPPRGKAKGGPSAS